MTEQTTAKTVAFYTLGCKQNQYETDYLREAFKEHGFDVVEGDEADVAVINTCTVTQRASAKCRQMIRRAVRNGSAVVVTGCYGQISPQDLADIPGVTLVTGVHDRHKIMSWLDEILRGDSGPSVRVRPHEKGQTFQETPVKEPRLTRAFLKIQEGCDDYCTYCVVPYARGPSRSRPVGAILDEAKGLVERGYREIVITGTHLGLYGKEGRSELFPPLPEVVRKLCDLDGDFRLRLSSLEPHDVDEDLVECLKLPQVCHHLHLPLQSGSDEILRRMGRRYTVDEFLGTVQLIRQVAPGAGITTDIIVGFPGETEGDFQSTLKVAKEAQFSRIHAFKFSARPGTPACDFPGKVRENVKGERVRELISLGKELSGEFCRKHVGATQKVLVEDQRTDALLTGLTGNYLRCFFQGPDDLMGQIVCGKATRQTSDGVYLEDIKAG